MFYKSVIGRVLIWGEKGTAKFTAVRAFEELLPEREEVKGCIFDRNPYDISSMCDECPGEYGKATAEEIPKIKGRILIDLFMKSDYNKK
jgi:magnesium chelatase subunit D